ncbi:MAG: PEP-CTERM sorting domain-containing protein [Betaproteobacteria bacterium]|nr:PEP-CTERM sorting domain-containing protein [Betaproteobacteria bacterium]
MNTKTKFLLSALLFTGSITTASASAVITKIEASGAGLGSFTPNILDNVHHILDLSKTFASVNPIDLTFTVAHGTGDGSPYNVVENITNSTGVNWTDFHFSITEPDRGNGVVFTNFNKSALSGFTLDSAPTSGPRNLNFTGALASGNDAHALFNLSPFDPGAGNTTTFVLHQVPTIPEPEIYAMLLIGLGLLGVTARRKK